MLRLGQVFEADKAADKYFDTALNHTPQCESRNREMHALSGGDDNASDGDVNDEHSTRLIAEGSNLCSRDTLTRASVPQLELAVRLLC